MTKAIYSHMIGKDPLYKTWHASDSHMFMYIHSGAGSIVCAEETYPMTEGLLVYVAAETYHYTMPDEPEHYDRSKIFIRPESMESVLALLKENQVVRDFSEKAMVCARIPEHGTAAVEAIFQELSQQESWDDHSRLLEFSGVLRLLYYLHEYATQSTPAVTGFVNRAIRFIGENISWDISLEDICHAVNISKFYFCRQFKAHTSMTVMEYILNTRIVLAKNELKKTDLSIMQISEKCGFSSTSYFCRVFRERVGYTPMQYRKRNS